MITTRASILKYLDEFLQVPLFTDYCPNGLQIEGKENLRSVATAVSASLEAIQEAVRLKTDLLLVHHGIFWNKDTFPITGIKRQKIELLLRHGISLATYHLPLDAHKEVGNNWKAALDLGWRDLQPFGYGSLPIGVKGQFKTKSFQAFQQELEEYYRHPAAVAIGGKSKVTSAALISGGAYKEIEEACKAGVDCFITGSFDEPVWHIAKEAKINFLALGHSATEEVGIRTLGEHLHMKFKLPHTFIDIRNPF